MNVSSSAKRHTCDAVQAKQPEPTTSAAAGTRLRIGREPESRVSMRAPPDPHPPATPPPPPPPPPQRRGPPYPPPRGRGGANLPGGRPPRGAARTPRRAAGRP